MTHLVGKNEISTQTVSIYDITQDTNIVSWMGSDPAVLQTVLNTNTHSLGAPGSVSDAVSSMPNCVKALMIAPISPSSVNWQWSTEDKDIVSDVTVSSTFKINYGFLAQVQMLDGFSMTSGDPQSEQHNEPSIKEPVWRKLEERDYAMLTGKEILCRLDPYQLEAIGIRAYDGLKLDL